MRSRDKFYANERRDELFTLAGGRCVVCGRWLRKDHPQLAHRVINSGHNQDVLPDEILHHPANTIPVDNSGRCNSAVILKNLPAEDHLERIRRDLDGTEPIDIREYYAELSAQFAATRTRVDAL